MRLRTARDGMGLLEVITLLIVLALLAAVVVPASHAVETAKRIERAERSLGRILSAIEEFEADVRHCPGTLSQLVVPLVPGDTALTGGAYSGGERNRWDGPYYNLLIPASGPQGGIGTVTGLRRIGLLVTSPAIVLTADIFDAVAIDGAIDSGDGAAAGSIRWTVISGSQVEVEYRSAILCL